MVFTKENRGARQYLRYRLLPEEEIDLECLQAMLKSSAEGILPYELSQDGAELCLCADITDKISFSKLFSVTLNRKQILTAFSTMLNAMLRIPFEERALPFLTRSEDLFWSAEEQKSYLLFFPVLQNGKRNEIDLRAFLQELLFQVKFDQSENWGYITQLAAFLKEEAFSLVELQKLVEALQKQPKGKTGEGEEGTKERPLCKICGSACRPDARFCTKCGAQLPAAKGDDPETTVLSPQELAMPYLLRLKTGEKVYIDKLPFLIGKEEDKVDYGIPENNAVSRVHAEVFKRNKDCFIVDKHSTNHTFVDGQMVQQNVESKLSEGCKVRLADEEFTFHLF